MLPEKLKTRCFATQGWRAVDLGHNFVLADSKCNSQKRDRLPACDHLAAWAERNRLFRFYERLSTTD
jgi:hypothetical protein